MQNLQKINIVPYGRDQARSWDAFVSGAKNGHFFFQRGYLEYHSQRFEDASLVVLSRNRIVAVLPANVCEGTVFSHQGLTYGGFVVNHTMTGSLMIAVFEVALDHLRRQGIHRVVYKAMPHIYHREPSQEDLYALHRLGARMIRRDLSSALELGGPVCYSKGKRYNLIKARKRNLTVTRSYEFRDFMLLLEEVMDARHDLRPAHNATEIELLAKRFPENIHLYCTYGIGKLLAGALVFVNPTIVHTQYLANSPAGREFGALDFLLDILIREAFSGRRYLSFGISTEHEGERLNEGLLHSKEAFGARGIVHDTYEISL
ncbi:MAG: GNAT family N-acetyltransferase [Nitrospira sp.]